RSRRRNRSRQKRPSPKWRIRRARKRRTTTTERVEPASAVLDDIDRGHRTELGKSRERFSGSERSERGAEPRKKAKAHRAKRAGEAGPWPTKAHGDVLWRRRTEAAPYNAASAASSSPRACESRFARAWVQPASSQSRASSLRPIFSSICPHMR